MVRNMRRNEEEINKMIIKQQWRESQPEDKKIKNSSGHFKVPTPGSTRVGQEAEGMRVKC